MLKRLLLLLCLLSLALSILAAERPYHAVLEASPAAPFPFLSKFGTVEIHLYGGGVRAETVWLNGFSRNGGQTITVENPYGRMYTEVPLAEVAPMVKKLGGTSLGLISAAPSQVLGPVGGKVRGLDAERYRLLFSAEAWIDIWTTRAIPENAQYRAIVREFTSGVSPAAANIVSKLPGVPVYVELNFRRYKKLPLVRLKSLEFDNKGEEDALSVGTIYFRAPLLESLWK